MARFAAFWIRFKTSRGRFAKSLAHAVVDEVVQSIRSERIGGQRVGIVTHDSLKTFRDARVIGEGSRMCSRGTRPLSALFDRFEELNDPLSERLGARVEKLAIVLHADSRLHFVPSELVGNDVLRPRGNVKYETHARKLSERPKATDPAPIRIRVRNQAQPFGLIDEEHDDLLLDVLENVGETLHHGGELSAEGKPIAQTAADGRRLDVRDTSEPLQRLPHGIEVGVVKSLECGGQLVRPKNVSDRSGFVLFHLTLILGRQVVDPLDAKLIQAEREETRERLFRSILVALDVTKPRWGPCVARSPIRCSWPRAFSLGQSRRR